ncbi:MAG: hypothetical protein MIL41_20420 [Hyphomicrobiales bacterium]|jgi:hypothetical protein
MMRFWRPYLACVGLYVVGSLVHAFGPSVESRLALVRVDQRVHEVERAAGLLCWNWAGTKVRDLASDNLDAFLRVGEARDRFVVAVANQKTGMPWNAGAAPRPGPVDERFCTVLPPHVRDADRLRLEWIAYYPGGGLGLWTLRLPLPDVLSEGTP